MLLTLVDDKFQLQLDSGQKITLTRFELAGMVQLAAGFQDQLPIPAGVRLAAGPPRNPGVYVGLDSHHTMLVVQIVEAGDLERTYSFTLEEAESIRDNMSKRIEQLRQALKRPLQ